MKNNFDVVVVGAGPAGSFFSRLVAKAGFDVLMLDRRKEIGIPVRCGEGAGHNVFKLTGIKPHKDWAYLIKSSHMLSKAGSRASYTSENQGYVIERRVFDKLMALKALDAGANLMAGTTVVGYQKGKVVAESFHQKQEFKAKLIVAADGIESYIARMAGLSKSINPHDLDSCFQYEMKGIQMKYPHTIESYLGSMAPRGYVWIFPKGEDRANVGLGVAGDDPRPAKEYLDAFINAREDLRSASITQVSSGNISVSKPLEKLVDDQLMVIGTAARQVSPIHGGGIQDALQAAEIAAGVAIEALKEEDYSKKKLMDYQTTWFKKHGQVQIMQYKLMNAMSHLTDDDFDYYIRNFKLEYFNKMWQSNGILELLKVLLMRRPNLKSIVAGLLS
jgi:digeranylgeranylglycerophospholipid reductase